MRQAESLMKSLIQASYSWPFDPDHKKPDSALLNKDNTYSSTNVG